MGVREDKRASNRGKSDRSTVPEVFWYTNSSCQVAIVRIIDRSTVLIAVNYDLVIALSQGIKIGLLCPISLRLNLIKLEFTGEACFTVKWGNDVV